VWKQVGVAPGGGQATSSADGSHMGTYPSREARRSAYTEDFAREQVGFGLGVGLASRTCACKGFTVLHVLSRCTVNTHHGFHTWVACLL
jgi:hypothetical protein